MSRLSPAGLLIVAAALVPVFVELPVVLSFLGIDLSWTASFGLGVLAFLLVLVWSEVTEKPESSTEA